MFLPISTKARRFYLSAVFGTMVLASAQQGLTQTNSFQLASQERQSPDVVVKRIELGDGSTSLANWRERAPDRPSQRKMLIPRHPSYQGARLFYEKSMQPTPRAATEHILSMSGFRGAVYKAESSGNREFVRTIDGHPRSAITTFMYEGTLGGQPAKAYAAPIHIAILLMFSWRPITSSKSWAAGHPLPSHGSIKMSRRA